MDRLKHLLIISINYPRPDRPTYGTFVRNTVHGFVKQGVRCTVLSPQPSRSVKLFTRGIGHHIQRIDSECVEGKLEVYQIPFFSVGARSKYAKYGPLNPTVVSTKCFLSTVSRSIRYLNLRPDAVYGHFLHFPGICAAFIGNRLGIPAFACIGEGELWTVERYGWKRSIRELASLDGFLANSSVLKKECAEKLHLSESKIGVFPNGIDPDRFYPRDRIGARARFGFPQDGFLVVSVGNFLHKKGICRVGEAIDGLPGVYGVFVGSGPEHPKCENSLFCDRIPNAELPILLSACDLFVLPTLIEGSCNAIVEAMACGLPVISSNNEFNDDLLVSAMSIRVGPLDVEAIRAAILTIRDDSDLREGMSGAALEHAKNFDVNDRARRMIEFMQRSVL